MRGGGGHALGQRRGQRTQHGLEHAIGDDRAGPAAGRRPRVEERALGRLDRDRAEGAVVLGAVGVGQALHGGVAVGARVVDVGVEARLRLGPRPREVDHDVVAPDGHRRDEPHRVRARAAVVEEVLERVDAVGDPADGGPDLLLGAVHDLGHGRPDRLVAVALGQLDHPELAHAERVPLGAEVPEHRVRHPRVGEDQGEDVLLLPAALPRADGRDVQPLLEPVEDALDGLAAGAHPTHVRVVEDVRHEADESPIGEIRRLDHEEVGEVAGAEVRAVEEDDVAGVEAVPRRPLPVG